MSRSVCPSGLTHSLTITHSLTHSLNLTVETLGCSALSQLARTFVRSFVRSCVRSFLRSVVRSFGRSFVRSFVRCVRSVVVFVRSLPSLVLYRSLVHSQSRCRWQLDRRNLHSFMCTGTSTSPATTLTSFNTNERLRVQHNEVRCLAETRGQHCAPQLNGQRQRGKSIPWTRGTTNAGNRRVR